MLKKVTLIAIVFGTILIGCSENKIKPNTDPIVTDTNNPATHPQEGSYSEK